MPDDVRSTVGGLIGLPEDAGRFSLFVFAAHAAVALGVFWLAASLVPENGIVSSLPVFGIGVLVLVLGRSAARLAALR